MVAVVARWSPPKPPVGKLRTHAHLHIGSKLLALKGREQSLKDPEETEKWADCSPHCSRARSRNHPPPWRIPASLQSEGPSQSAERWAFSARSARFPLVSLDGWRYVLVTDTASLPQYSVSTLRESKQARLSWLLPSSVSLVSKGKEGRPTEQGKSPKGMNFN